MSKQEFENRYQYWVDIAQTAVTPKRRRAARILALAYKKQLDRLCENA